MRATPNDRQNHQPPRRIVSVREFLQEVPISREAAYRAFKEGKLPCMRFGKKVLVDVDECLEAMRGKSQ